LIELPDARVKSAKLTERYVRGDKAAFEEVRRSAIEILIPRGPRALYGLLAAELSPKESGSLVIRVAASDHAGRPFPDSIALSSEEARVGLPLEFSQAVFEGATGQIERTVGMCSGELVFDRAVHGLVGSAPIVFRWLAARLVQVLAEGDAISQQRLTEILQTEL